VWQDSSSSYSYTNWAFGEPNDMFYRDQQLSCSGEDCAQIKKFSGNVTWHDLGCDTVLPYICERVRGEISKLLIRLNCPLTSCRFFNDHE